MKYGFPALIFVFAFAARIDGAGALDAALVSAESPQTIQRQAGQTQGSTRNLSARASCREVDVALDEGYGVSRHETRYECDARVP
jgi:hypothetical protein